MATLEVGFTVRVRDSAGDERNVAMKAIVDSVDLDPLVAIHELYQDRVDNVVSGRVVGGTVTLNVAASGNVKGAPLPNTRVRSGAALSALASSGDRETIYIPTFQDGKLVNGQVILTDTDVSNLTGMLTSQQTNGSYTVDIINKSDRQFTAVPEGFYTTRR